MVLLKGVGNTGGCVLCWGKIDLEMKLFEFSGGSGTDGCNLATTDGANVVVCLEEPAEILLNPVGAGENEPVVVGDSEYGVDEGLFFVWGYNLDGRYFKDIGTQISKACGKSAGLAAGTRDDNALTKKWALLEPVEVFAQSDYCT